MFIINVKFNLRNQNSVSQICNEKNEEKIEIKNFPETFLGDVFVENETMIFQIKMIAETLEFKVYCLTNVCFFITVLLSNYL